MIKIKNIEETTQVSDVGTFKKGSLPLLQVKFKDYNAAKAGQDSVWDLLSKTIGIPKSNIKVDSSHLDKHTHNYSRPLMVSYNLDSSVSVLNVDKNIASKSIGKAVEEIEGMDEVVGVYDLLSKS